jgi:hypothetical protein
MISIFVLSCLHAQIKKGSIFLGGDIGGSTAHTTSADTAYRKQNGIYISPVFGKAIKDNLVFGVHAGFSLTKDHFYDANPNQETKNYSAGIFLRKYKFIGNSGFSIFVESDFGYSYYQYKTMGPSYNYPSYGSKKHSVFMSAYPGLSYTVSKKLQLETGFNELLYFSYWNEKSDFIQSSTQVSSFSTNGFAISSSLNNISNLYLGFRLLIGK